MRLPVGPQDSGLDGPLPLVSIVIPCFNPGEYLFQAIASARAQLAVSVEIILVNDGTNDPSGLDVVKRAIPLVDRYIYQENRGLAAARNSGFRVAVGELVAPLDADDIFEAGFVAECRDALAACPDAAFAYADYRKFGRENFIERQAEYNLYQLLDRNTHAYAALIRHKDWELAGGYDEKMRVGYEDWEFWLRLGGLGRFGCHVPMVLFRYRKHGYSLLDVARSHHQQNIEYIQKKHAGMYSREGRAQIKARWFPATRILVNNGQDYDPAQQTLLDCATTNGLDGSARTPSAFLIASPRVPDANSAELAALAVWSGTARVELPDGSIACSADALQSGTAVNRTGTRSEPAVRGRLLETLHRHLVNAELLTWTTWRQKPVASLLRLIPLRFKEWVNRICGRALFDLSFYLQFRPGSVFADNSVLEPLVYMPRIGDRRRVALITPHLGPGGAEAMLYEIAGFLDRSRFEISLITVKADDQRWRGRWSARVDHIYDLGTVVSAAERVGGAIYSLVTNWKYDIVLIQNVLSAYSFLPRIREALPSARIIDLIHSIDEEWNIAEATATVAEAFDTRVAVSAAGAHQLRAAGTPSGKIRVIRAGIDTNRFRISTDSRRPGSWRILFAARLDPVKRPRLLAEIASKLLAIRQSPDFVITVAGDGPDLGRLRHDVAHAGLDDRFDFRGFIADIGPLIQDSDIVLLTSRNEGIPLIVLEALGCGKPVVSSAVGAVAEAVIHGETGLLIDRMDQEPERFARAINELIESSERREQLGEAGRLLVREEYSQERACVAWREIFG